MGGGGREKKSQMGNSMAEKNGWQERDIGDARETNRWYVCERDTDCIENGRKGLDNIESMHLGLG